MTLKNDEKSEDKLTCRFKIDRRNLTKFDSSPWVTQIYTLMGCFCPNYIMFELQKYRGVIFHDTIESDAKFEEILAFDLENDMRSLAKFHQSTQKSQN